MTAARRSSTTSPSSPAARWSTPTSACCCARSASTCWAPLGASWSPRTAPTIVDGGGTKEAIEGRAAQLRAEIETTDSDWDREKLEERLAKLSGGVAVIKVGAATETALKKRKEAVEDAVAAAKAAVEEGIVTGGGAALVQARRCWPSCGSR